MSPSRCSHTSAVDEAGRVWLFGGYQESGDPIPRRRVTNDLWCLDPNEGWLLMQGEDLASTERPGPRVYSASICGDGRLIVFGCWNLEDPSDSGTFLDDV